MPDFLNLKMRAYADTGPVNGFSITRNQSSTEEFFEIDTLTKPVWTDPSELEPTARLKLVISTDGISLMQMWKSPDGWEDWREVEVEYRT